MRGSDVLTRSRPNKIWERIGRVAFALVLVFIALCKPSVHGDIRVALARQEIPGY